MTRLDFVILDELGYLPFAQSGGQLLFHLISRLYDRTSIIVTTKIRLVAIGGQLDTGCQAVGQIVHEFAAMPTFRRTRDFAAWLGLVPRQHSSGDKQPLGRISKRASAISTGC